jgi:hypothetical protein
MRTRRKVLWLPLMAVAGLAAAGYGFTVDREDRTAQDGDGSKNNPAATVAATRPAEERSLLQLERLQTARAQPPAAELFTAKSWYVAPPPPPPPPPQAAPAPVQPTAPPLPFVFMGKMTDGERLTVFLVKDDRVYMSSAGEVIDGTYKLEKIESGQLTLRYLPLDTVQTLAAGDAP